MEDLSRDLENEVESHSRADRKPVQNHRRLYLIDDFGSVTPADWIRKAALSELVIILILVAVSGLSLILFLRSHQQLGTLETTIEEKDSRIAGLVKDKEILMARMALQGILPDGIDKGLSQEKSATSPEQEPSASTGTGGSPPVRDDGEDPKALTLAAAAPGSDPEATDQEVGDSDAAEPDTESARQVMVDIEDFRLYDNAEKKQLKVRFDIRNRSSESGQISGYVFVMLQPRYTDTGEWLVMPDVGLSSGMPLEPRKGQSFAIVNFKPVFFTFQGVSTADGFGRAKVIIYDKEALVMYQNEFDIQEDRG